MNRIKKHFSSLTTSICSIFISMLGFGCHSENYPDMYGMPVGDFEIKGSVTDEDGKTIENAEIRVTLPEIPSGYYPLQTSKTDKNGKYYIEGHECFQELKVVCLPSDIELEADSVIADLKYEDTAGLYLGHAEKNIDFTLKIKSKE